LLPRNTSAFNLNMTSVAKVPPFLRLPTELRLIIYEHLHLTLRYITIGAAPKTKLKAQLVIESLPVALLRVCRFIHHKVLTVLGPQLGPLRLAPPKMVPVVYRYIFTDYTKNVESMENMVNNVLSRVASAANGPERQGTNNQIDYFADRAAARKDMLEIVVQVLRSYPILAGDLSLLMHRGSYATMNAILIASRNVGVPVAIRSREEELQHVQEVVRSRLHDFTVRDSETYRGILSKDHWEENWAETQ
jgi:hypothetical protein